MAAGVVVDPEIVEVHDGDTGRPVEALHHVLVVAAVKRAGQIVMVELDAVAGGFAHQHLAVLGVDGGAPGSQLHQLQHAGPALHLVVAGRDVGDVGAAGLEAAGAAFGGQRQLGRAVAGEGVLVPAGKAQVRPGGVGACALGDAVDGVRVQQADIGIKLAADLHAGLHFFSRHNAPTLPIYGVKDRIALYSPIILVRVLNEKRI